MKERLIEAARQARANAYAPYSVYQVGAAVLGADGEIYTGCNVENVAFGPSMCAERVAVGKMVCAGCRELHEVALVTRDGGTPCGTCRQVLAEFAPRDVQVPVHCAGDSSEVTHTLGELLPHAFTTDI